MPKKNKQFAGENRLFAQGLCNKDPTLFCRNWDGKGSPNTEWPSQLVVGCDSKKSPDSCGFVAPTKKRKEEKENAKL